MFRAHRITSSSRALRVKDVRQCKGVTAKYGVTCDILWHLVTRVDEVDGKLVCRQCRHRRIRTPVTHTIELGSTLRQFVKNYDVLYNMI